MTYPPGPNPSGETPFDPNQPYPGQFGQYGPPTQYGPPNQNGAANQYGQGQYEPPAQGEYGQPGQSQYGPPNQGQYGPPNQGQYGPPNQGQYGPPNQGQYGPPNQGQYGQPIQPGWAPSGPSAPSTRGRKTVLVAAAAAVIVVAGAAVSYAALRDKNSGGGASSPQKAVSTIVTSLSKSDLLGVLDDLPPGERASIHDSFVAQVTQLKRLKVLNTSANVNKVSGVTFAARGLTYGSTVAVNDHVQLVTVTGGTLTVNSDASKVPYTKEFLNAAFDGKAPTQTSNQTVNLADQAVKSGHPLRIAVQKVNGKWYPSLMYTVLAAAALDDHLGTPTAADAIAPLGSGSADDAVRSLITAGTKQDYKALIALLDPNEDAALHDYGTLLLQHAPAASSTSVDLKNITFTDTSVAGGTRVSLKSVQFTNNNQTVTITIDGQCAAITSGSTTTRQCALNALEKYGSNLNLTAAQKGALTDLFAAIPKIGVVSTRSGGRWYISPIRTYSDLDTSILSNLKNDDLLTLIKLARSH